MEEQARITQKNDSIMMQIASSEKTILEQTSIGDRHEEGYELAYIKAYDELTKAFNDAEALSKGIGQEKMNDLLVVKDSIEHKLYQAYSNFINKATLFEKDEPDVSEEFKERANHISERIDVTKYNAPTKMDSLTDIDELTPILTTNKQNSINQ